jgi:hypothetical protein
MVLARVEVVCASVELTDESRRVTHEINNISVHGCLSAEREAIEMMSLQVSPQQHFRARHRAPKMLRSMALLFADGGVWHARLPPSLSLPRMGGGNPVALSVASTALHLRQASSGHHELSPPASVGRSSGRKP